MYDILELLHLDTKEDIYTFCLTEFINCSEELRKLSAEQWGFNKNEEEYWNIVKQMDTFFKYISMERQNYACLSI